MPFRRRQVVAAIVALMAVGLSGTEALGQRRALRRALTSAVRHHRQQSSSLLDRIFRPGGAAFRGADPRFLPFAHRRQSAPLVIHNHYTSNGTYFDPYSVGSFPDQFGAARAPLTAVDAGFAAYQSANAVNSGAAASLYSYLPPSASAYPDSRPGAGPIGPATDQLGAPFTPGWTTPQHDPAPVTSALMQIGRSPTASPPGYRLGLPTAVTDTGSAAALRRYDTEPEPVSDSVDAALGRGMKALQRGDYGRAVNAFRAAGRLGCADARYHVGLATAAFAVGQYSEAAAAVRADLLGSPHLDRSALDIRRSYDARDAFDFQLQRLTLAARRRPADAGLWLLLGYMRFYSGDRAGGANAWGHYVATPNSDPRIASFIAREATGTSAG